jgi:hypothetical protein
MILFRHHLRSTFAATAATCLLTACATAMPDCALGLTPTSKAELFFGRNIGAAEGVSDGAWQSFLDAEITPRFPDGLTVIASNGQWRGPDGRIIAERGFVLTVLAPSAAQRRSLNEIRAAYRMRFMQDAVLLIETPACAGF